MFGYYLDLAWRSLKRTPVMTGLMVLAIGLGIGASMTMLTVLHVMSGDPLPGRSAHLYRPFLNPLPLSYKLTPEAIGHGPNAALTWPDAKALLDARKGVQEVAVGRGNLVVHSTRPGVHPESVVGSFTTRDFFPMFGVPFIVGDPWPKQADAEGAPVVVLTEGFARKLFGNEQALGKSVQLGSHDFRVVGVVKDWHPEPLFYAVSASFNEADQFFLPLAAAVNMKLDSNWMSGWGDDTSLTSPTTSWLNFWVRLDTPRQVADYNRFLVNYSAQQKAAGRYERPPDEARLYGLMQWLHRQGMVPTDVLLQAWLALGFLFVCMVNIIALLLAKFLRSTGEISVRRALGATRHNIFVQFGIESGLIGLAGGLLGIGIAEFGLWSVRQRPDDYAQLAHMDGQMLVVTVVLAIAVSVVAGLLPAWRACRIAPALQLKTL
ncbi:MAG TPA: ABC transporter permease [Rhodanobacteraceae bacterium]|jgi:putative ABC transport system permease protein|nr:ABC transporter permease [Rhodanobacteraceae bacterium]